MEFGRNAFNEVLERVEGMPLEEQALIIEILENRYAEKRREEILRKAQKSLEEYRKGLTSNVMINLDVYEALVNAFDFPWLFQLQPKHRREFLSEFRKSWCAAVERGEWEQLRQTVEDWQATSAVDSEPEVAHYLKLPREKKEYKVWEEICVTL